MIIYHLPELRWFFGCDSQQKISFKIRLEHCGYDAVSPRSQLAPTRHLPLPLEHVGACIEAAEFRGVNRLTVQFFRIITSVLK